MSRVRTAFALLALAWLGVRPAQAQVAVYFQPLGDTATGAVPLSPATVEIRARDSLGATVQGANLTFFFDPTKIQVLGVQVLPGDGFDTIVDTVRGPGSFTINATGAAVGFDAALYRLQVQLTAGAASGTYLWVKADSVPMLGGGTSQAVGAIGPICHATTAWGDVDGNGTVDSRDALITLSAAVGLPANGFNLALGDVDGDGLANSRDALIMLSYTIGLPVSAPGARVALGIPDACPGLTAPGDSVVFLRNDAPAGLYVLGAASTVPMAIPGATATAPDPNARLSPDGKTVAYVCPGSGGWQICRINIDGSAFAQLTSDSNQTDVSPDWSPSGDSIVFLQNGRIAKMAAAGGGYAYVVGQTGQLSATEVKWGRDSTKIAYSNSGLYVFQPSVTSIPQLVATGFSDITGLRWSPAGDSIAFVRSTDPRLWVVPAGGGTPAIMFGFAGLINGGDWSSAGILLSLNTGAGAPSIWFSKGINSAIYRLTSPQTFDRSPTWRRSP